MGLWTCKVCSLRNYETNLKCQACFNDQHKYPWIENTSSIIQNLKQLRYDIFQYENKIYGILHCNTWNDTFEAKLVVYNCESDKWNQIEEFTINKHEGSRFKFHIKYAIDNKRNILFALHSLRFLSIYHFDEKHIETLFIDTKSPGITQWNKCHLNTINIMPHHFDINVVKLIVLYWSKLKSIPKEIISIIDKYIPHCCDFVKRGLV
eukprot:368287_1